MFADELFSSELLHIELLVYEQFTSDFFIVNRKKYKEFIKYSISMQNQLYYTRFGTRRINALWTEHSAIRLKQPMMVRM